MNQTHTAERIEMQSVDALIPYAKNARTHSEAQVAQLAASIRSFGFTQPVLIDGDGVIVAGHGRVMAARAVGLAVVPTIRIGWLTDAQRRAYILADNKIALNSGWDQDLLVEELQAIGGLGVDMSLIGFDTDELAGLLAAAPDPAATGSAEASARETPRSAGGMDKAAAATSLAARFMVPPFSVLSAREGWWQQRKSAWLSLGIRSELGRGAGGIEGESRGDRQTASLKGELTVKTTTDPYRKRKRAAASPLRSSTIGEATQDEVSSSAGYETGTSVFDPVLCELCYRWFSPPAGTIVDPFAGGSVRGVVASRLGRKYIGHELRAEQVQANREQALAICGESSLPPTWIEGDSRTIDESCADVAADLLFSCPPYADLEVYSDDPRDLSTMAYPAFREAYREIIAKASALLKPDRFACFVVGEVRGEDGNYYGLVPDTIAAFRAAGLEFYNEAILVTHLGSLPLRVGKQFSGSRKLGKTHQNVLVFLKGDAKRAVEACGAVEIADEALSAPAAEEGASPIDDLSKYGEVMQ